MEKMNYDEFKEYVAANIREFLPEEERDNEVVVEKVTKVNQKLDGLIIKRPGATMFPNIYLEKPYKQYENGADIDEILQEIADVWMEGVVKEIESQNLKKICEKATPEMIKENVYFQLINKEKNRNLLKQVPHREFCDLAIIYRYLIEEKNDALVNAVVTNNWLSDGMTEQNLYDYATVNTERLLGVCVTTMEEMIIGQMESLKQTLVDPFAISKVENMIEETKGNFKKSPSPYIITNKKGINGAAVMLNTAVMEDMSDMMCGDLLIIPSSIHECIVFPKSAMAVEEACNMLHDANKNALREEDYLSDSVYFYNSETGEITEACESLKMQIV